MEKIIKTHDDKKWEFYFEQGVINIDGAPAYDFLNKIGFISEASEEKK